MRTALAIAALIAPALLAACSTTPEQAAERAAAQAALVPAATPDGPPERCIPTRNIRTSQVRNDSVIDFEMITGRTYRNTLPQSCTGLGFEDRFGYRSTNGQLCSIDTITVIRQGVAGPTCGLGDFQPVRPNGK